MPFAEPHSAGYTHPTHGAVDHDSAPQLRYDYAQPQPESLWHLGLISRIAVQSASSSLTAATVEAAEGESAMFMGIVDVRPGVVVYPELAGARVLITGLTATAGVDIARAFAEHKAQLVLQAPDSSPEMQAVLAVLNEHATEIKVYPEPFGAANPAVRFTQEAARAYGGLDVIVNLVSVTKADLAGRVSDDDVENLVRDKLTAAAEITKVAANRMGLIWSQGLIVNIVVAPEAETPAETMLVAILRTALAVMTRTEAGRFADKAIRVNAIGPAGDASGSDTSDVIGGARITSEPDIAAMALHLASKKGRHLSGLVFDAEGVASRRC